jgi:large repetitive protein
MEGVDVTSRPRTSSRGRVVRASVLAGIGLSLTASAAFGGLGSFAGSIRDHIYCDKPVRDCVYDEPTTKITEGPKGRTDDSTPTFRFQSEERGVSFRCRMDGKPFRSCSSPHTVSDLEDGKHVFEVYAVDRDGLRDRSPASSEFFVDTEAPECTAIKGPKVTGDRTPVFRLAADDPRAKFSYRLDRRGAYKTTDEKLELRKLDRGKHVLEVRAQDKAGNQDGSPEKKVFRVSGNRKRR